MIVSVIVRVWTASELTRLKESWKDRFQNAHTDTRRDELAFTLLTIRKAKTILEANQSTNDWTGSVESFRDQLMLRIAHFYSDIGKFGSHSRYHILFFLKTLSEFSDKR